MPYFHHMTNMQVLRAFGRQSKEKKCDGDVDRLPLWQPEALSVPLVECDCETLEETDAEVHALGEVEGVPVGE